MNKVVLGSLLAASLAFGCSKDKSEERPAETKSSLRGSKRSHARKAARKPAPAPAPAPTTECELAQGEHAQPPSFTFQNGLTVEEKGNEKDKPKATAKGKTKPYAGTTDAVIDMAEPTSNAGAEPTLVLKGGKKPRRGLVRWDLSSLPATTTIQGACMALFAEEPSVNPFAVYELLKDWSEPKVTWTSATAETAWAMPGAWAETEAGPQVTTVLAKAGGVQTVALPTSLVQKWISEGANNHGLILAATHRASDSLTISSANSPTASQRPALLIWKK